MAYMVLLDESLWRWPVGWPSSPLKRRAAQAASCRPDAECERPFDLADSMEKGMARELTSDFLVPLPQANRLWEFYVERSSCRLQYRLFCHNGDFLMYARVASARRRIEIFLYDPDAQDGLFDEERPVFTVSWSASKSEWSLEQQRCDECQCKPRGWACSCRLRELCHVRHYRCSVGGGLNNCMELGADSELGPITLTSVEPSWNEKVSSLVLDFFGRKVVSSAKNFQLELDSEPGVICQYGKLREDLFGLDFKHPMTVAQAFGVSLTTLFWV